MPLRHRPHTLPVLSASENVSSGGTVVGTDREASSSVRGQLTPADARSVVERWGVEISRPHLFLFNLADADRIGLGDWLEYGDRRFVVKALKVWDAEARTAHVEALLEEME